MADLSQGRFTEKWGALTAALWLEAEAAGARHRDLAVRSLIRAGPDGIWELMAERIAPDLRTLLVEIRDLQGRCD